VRGNFPARVATAAAVARSYWYSQLLRLDQSLNVKCRPMDELHRGP